MNLMERTTGLFVINRRKRHSDVEVVEALGRRDRAMEEWFYHTAKRYFDDHFNEVFFDKDRKQEIFQAAFLKLWTEVDNHRIHVGNGEVCRLQADGNSRPMTCSLTTFLMAFARTEYRELVRSLKEDPYAELFDDASRSDTSVANYGEENAEETKNRIIDECIQGMSPSCIEILTLFYYQGKSLDQIMVIRGERNTSKDGLKTAKNKCMNTLKERAMKRLAEVENS